MHKILIKYQNLHKVVSFAPHLNNSKEPTTTTQRHNHHITTNINKWYSYSFSWVMPNGYY